MLPEPLHPAVVHFPIVLAFLLPISVLGALWAIRRGTSARMAWAIPLGVAAALTLSSWVALETGEDQEERVESVVGEAALHAHEEAAERFLVFAGVTTVIALAGLLGGTLGTAARGVTLVGSAVLLVGAYQVGDAGGRLVYRHGAAQAYATTSAGVGADAYDGVEGRGGGHDEAGEDEER